MPDRASVPSPGRLPAGDLLERYCAGCADITTHEVPLCPDGHDSDCPELVCTDCGAAVLAGVVGAGVLRAGVGGTGRRRGRVTGAA